MAIETVPDVEEMAIEALIDLVYDTERTIAVFQNNLQAAKHTLMCRLIAEDLKNAYSSKGMGYALVNAPTQYQYKPGALAYLEEKGMLHYFTPEPKITRSKLEELRKQDLLTYADFAEIEKHTLVLGGEMTLRKVVKKEAAGG